ncbi:MAG: GNAT family N-acetyltransferase [Planctomycetes bacterium]|nr:GNAT family N-acetyltransferase [Planctomycetota bacterium]
MSFEPTTTLPGTRVVRFHSLDPLASRAGEWDRMTRDVPFRSWAWASHWWRHYGDDPRRTDRKTALFTLGVLDQTDALLGLAPWYVEDSLAEGRVLRFLGTGEVCSDYLSVLSEPGKEDLVSRALADWLSGARTGEDDRPQSRDSDRWDLLELTGVDAEDTVVGHLADQLKARGNTVHRRAGPNCWRIELPTSWEEYLGRLSKDHRKQIRRTTRGMLATGRVRVHGVERLEDLPRAQEVLIDLHQRRRLSQGEPGCFASSRFTAFHRNVMPDLLRGGQLRLDWLELDGEPVAAEYQLTGDGVVYAYQAGVNPDALEHSPGRLGHVAMLRRSIEQGYRAVDFLRGDEPYKAHWRAEPRASLEIRVVPTRTAAQLRHGVWRVGTSVKQWAKSGLRLVGGESVAVRGEG